MADTEINGSDRVQASGTQQETSALAVPEETKPDPYDPKFAKEAVKHKNNIKVEFGKIDRSVFKIAFEVHWLYDNQAYIPLGYDNIYDLAKSEFGIARGTTSDYINMVDRFGERDDLDNFTGNIMEKYKPYSSSKLISMHDLLDSEIDSLLKPEMSVREIKGIVNKVLGKSVDGSPDNEADSDDKGKEDASSQKNDPAQGHSDKGGKTENKSTPAFDPATDSEATGDTKKKDSAVINGCVYHKLCTFSKEFFDSDDWKERIIKSLEDSHKENPYRWFCVGYV